MLSGGLPNIPLCRVGPKLIPSISEIVSRIFCQESNSLGHVQNMRARLHVVCEYLLNLKSDFSGNNFDSFSLL